MLDKNTSYRKLQVVNFCQYFKKPEQLNTNINLFQELTYTKQTFQRCFNVVFWLIRRRDVGQRRINVVYFNDYISSVRKLRNSFVTFNVEFNNVGKRQNNIVKMTIFKKNKTIILNRIHAIQSFNYYFIIFFTLLPMIRGICRRVLAKSQKFLQAHEKYCIART